MGDTAIGTKGGWVGFDLWGSARIAWMYPDIYNGKDFVDIDLMHVRASAGIRLRFDSTRNGWVILAPSVFEWEVDDEACDPCFKEVAFVPAWPFEHLASEIGG
jgi:hypothetical protein